MVLYLEEFKKQEPKKGKMLNYYDKLPEYLHDMSVSEILKHINRNGVRTAYMQKSSILNYFIWLHKEYGIDLVHKNYELQQELNRDSKTFVGFYNLNSLKKAINEGLIKAEGENAATLPDYSGLIAIFYLEWYGILPESAISIRLTDVSDNGNRIFVPDENRTIEIKDNEIANYFSDYKQKTGFIRFKNSNRETPYTQTTFYRNTSNRGERINEKTIYNIRRHFIINSGDERFSKKRIYYSGRYFEMFETESKLGFSFTSTIKESSEMICKIFNSDLSLPVICTILREYKIYRKNYLEIL